MNLGTPESPTPAALRNYLKEFLWDPRVVEIPRPIWWLLLNLIILNIRPRKSAMLYKKIWSDQGSPLLIWSTKLGQTLERYLNKKNQHSYKIEVAMRYGSPSIPAGMEKLRQAQPLELFVLPLYPQYSSATVGSVVDAVADVLKTWRYIPDLKIITDYHDQEFYIRSLTDRINAFWRQQGQGSYLLFSFHGLPEKTKALGDPYYQQCHETARLVAEQLVLEKDQWQLVFQSRFGFTEWLTPYCCEVLKQLPQQGIKQVDMVCPGFAVDCLETLEEIAIRNRQLFLESGGVQYRYIPALNCEQSHVETLSRLIVKN